MAWTLPSVPGVGTIATVANWAQKVIDCLRFIKGTDGPVVIDDDLTVDNLITAGNVDGVDVSVHKGGDAKAQHTGGAGTHTHQSAGAEGGKLDHGAALDGLGDDDHTQYIQKATVTPMCSTNLANDQVIPNDTATIVDWDSEDVDTDGMHDNGANPSRITCKTAGKYLFVVDASWDANATGHRFHWFHHLSSVGGLLAYGGAVKVDACSTAGNSTYLSSSAIFDMTVDQYVEVEVRQTSGGNLNWATTSRFYAIRIGT